MEPRTPSELLAQWLDGELDRDASAELLRLLQEKSDLLEDAARLKSFDRLLRVAIMDAGPDAFVEEVAARCGVTPGAAPLAPSVHWRVRRQRWISLSLAAGIVLAAALLFWWQITPVATVARLESVRWKDGQAGLHAGDELRRGPFSLRAGFVELRFRNGAELLVEGPAEFHIVSRSRVRISSGNAFAHVPPTATGFTIEGPTGRVIDRGTDFGVHVGQNAMEVHVLKGLVEAGQGSALRQVRENEALRMSSSSVSAIPADQARFLTGLPPIESRPINWVHWGFDEGDGTSTKPRSGGAIAAGAPAQLLSLEGTSPGPKWTNGQFGAALSFDGEDDYVQTDFPGIGGNAARTVAFWAKVPRNFEPKNGYAMVCWGSSQELTEGWQISVNPKDEQGPMGRIRIARIGGPIIGSTDLRDDRWHHIAVVFFGGEHPQRATTQVLVYVDGELEQTTRNGVLIVRTDTASPNARKVAFGLNIGPANPNPERPPTWRVFRGCLDEVFICDAALCQEQVRDLMSRNTTNALAAPADL